MRGGKRRAAGAGGARRGRVAELWERAGCRECSVSVTRMDFAKILGKFTKVKIQYESAPPAPAPAPAPAAARLRGNRNGMVLLHRAAYKEHPVKETRTPVKETRTVAKEAQSLSKELRSPTKEQQSLPATTPGRPRGRPPKNKAPLTPQPPTPQPPTIRTDAGKSTEYRIVFEEQNKRITDEMSEISITMAELLPRMSVSMLPTHEWVVDYAPRNQEPKRDHVYDRIAAELEDLMQDDREDPAPTKLDDFPSIMDLLSDPTNGKENNNDSIPLKASIDELKNEDTKSMDVEASEESKNVSETKPSTENSELPNDRLDKGGDDASKENETTEKVIPEKMETDDDKTIDTSSTKSVETDGLSKPISNSMDSSPAKKKEQSLTLPNEKSPSILGDKEVNVDTITDIIFKRVKDDECNRLVKCTQNLNYSIEIDGKPVELLGAPKYISCVEDLQVMLQIVHESDLRSFNVVSEGLNSTDLLFTVMN